MPDTPQPQEWSDELREYIDRTLKPKKSGIKNLDREIIIDFVRKQITKARAEGARAECEAFENWMWSNGITHKDSVRKLLIFVKSRNHERK